MISDLNSPRDEYGILPSFNIRVSNAPRKTFYTWYSGEMYGLLLRLQTSALWIHFEGEKKSDLLFMLVTFRAVTLRTPKSSKFSPTDSCFGQLRNMLGGHGLKSGRSLEART